MHLKTDTGSSSHFSRVPTISRSRNGFSVAEKHVTTIGFDYLYPIYHKYIYPGDTINVTQNIMARLCTQVTTLYDDLFFDVHAWYVPMRLLQTNWARYQFNSQPTGPTQDNSALTSPKITLTSLTTGFGAKTLYDYFGLPIGPDLSGNTQHINNYLGRAYNMIWNENYRDQNLQTALTVELDDGPDNPGLYELQKRGRRHDKFTSCLTAPQKGTAVTLPLGSVAPVITTSVVPVFTPTSGTGFDDGRLSYSTTIGFRPVTPGTASDGAHVAFASPTGLQADLSAATSATINQVRQSYAVQHLLEADARGGTRDVEAIQNRWGVTVPDFRLQRPEYLGGQTFTFDGHIVPATAESGTIPQASLAQFSQALSGLRIMHSFQEHGIFMILISARSNLTYQYGLQKELSYRTRYDWYQPEFANLGEVAVKNKEIYVTGGGGASDDNTWGYQEYAYELRYSENRVTAEMRSSYAQSLDAKHMAEDLASVPTLDGNYIQSDTPIARNIATDPYFDDPIQLNMLTAGMIARTLPMYSIPGLKRL